MGAFAVPSPRASKALARFTVLDLTRVRAGPACVRQLADWGANVIKVEAPPDGGEPMGGPRDNSDFQNLHRNKRSITLNLKSPQGLAAFKRLVKKADVVVENFRPNVKKRLGIDYKALARVNPRLVYASISGFGQDGPYAGRPGFDQIAQGMGGLMSITGPPGQGPYRVGIPVADLTAGLFAALGILVALLERDKAGNNHPTTIPTGVFKTKDGLINIATTGGKMWERFCDAIGAAAIARQPEYATASARSQHRDALHAEIEAQTQLHASADLVERLNAAGVPCGPINTIDKVFADPQVRHLKVAQAVGGGKGKGKTKALTLLDPPVSLSRTPSKLVRRPPGQ